MSLQPIKWTCGFSFPNGLFIGFPNDFPKRSSQSAIVGTPQILKSMSAHPVPDLQLQLMMSFARIHLGHEHIERIHALGPQITDWSAFATKSTWHFTAPLCLYHLAKFEPVAWVHEAKEVNRP